MKPSPPNRPAPIFLVNATSISMPVAAHRNASFWKRNSPPCCARSSATTLPGYGAEKAARALPPPVLVNDVMKKLSPAKRRLRPAMNPPPVPVSIVIVGVHVEHRAGLGADRLAGIELDLDDLEVVADEAVVDVVGSHGDGEGWRVSETTDAQSPGEHSSCEKRAAGGQRIRTPGAGFVPSPPRPMTDSSRHL